MSRGIFFIFPLNIIFYAGSDFHTKIFFILLSKYDLNNLKPTGRT